MLLDAAYVWPYLSISYFGVQEVPVQGTCKDKQFSQWYSSDDIFVNLQKVIPEVLVTVQCTQEQNMDENEDNDPAYLLAPATPGSSK